MKILITSAYPYHPKINFTPAYLKDSAGADLFKVHELTDDPENADMILFAENHHDDFFIEVLKNDLYKKYRQKCYLYHDEDYTVTFLPTISPSVTLKNYDPLFHHPFCYVIQIETNTYVAYRDNADTKKYLYSFIGASRTHPVRRDILMLNDKESYMLDTSNQNSWELSDSEKDEYYKNYAQKCFESKFILCPAGLGPNSYRLYESLKMGIAPIIISDEWIPSPGPKWEDFSIRIKEGDVHKIPTILREKEKNAAQMGAAARQAWLDWFDKKKQFHYLTEACSKLHASRHLVTSSTYAKQYRRLLEPKLLKSLLRSFRFNFKNYISLFASQFSR